MRAPPGFRAPYGDGPWPDTPGPPYGAVMSETAARTVSLVVVDDHPVVRDGLRGMFTAAPGFEVLGEARRTGWTPSPSSNGATPTSS